jgi:5-methylcytosine-specific restriction protein B
MSLIAGYEFYKQVQGNKYDKTDLETKKKLTTFRHQLGEFTDGIFLQYGLVAVQKGMWQNSGNFTKYMWNRYKFDGDNSNLVIYFEASAIAKGLFVSIGLIDDKLNEFEKENYERIYDFLENECKKIECDGFKRHDRGWGDRVFSIIDIENFEKLDYECILNKLKQVYQNTIIKFYLESTTNDKRKTLMPNTNQPIYPLNQILYGPPGTGKTYNTINKEPLANLNPKLSSNQHRYHNLSWTIAL